MATRSEGVAPTALIASTKSANETPALHFALLANIAKETNLENLSMGMSSDYDVAIKLGATHIRLGTALFGSRDT